MRLAMPAWLRSDAARSQSGLSALESAQRVLGYSFKQFYLSLELVSILVLATYFAKGYVWLGLFFALLMPLALTTWIVLLGQKSFAACRNWNGLWALSSFALALSVRLGLWTYHIWMADHGLQGLSDLQLAACIIGIDLVAIIGPFWRDQNQARTLQMAQLKQAALAAELKALQAQIEPHFLYNTLANSRYLARHDPDKAVLMLDHLIAYLHSALPDMRSSMSTLEREFELAEHYLALMAIRFGERLQYQLEYAPHLRHAALPPLMLISLVENAIVHGVEPQPGIVCVSLLAEAGGQNLRIVVRDNGAGIASGTLGSGVGLRNLRERLGALFGDAGGFTLRAMQTQGTEAEITLPLNLPQ